MPIINHCDIMSYLVLRDELDDNGYKMPTLELSSEEVSLLKMCVALVLGGVFQIKWKRKRYQI
jgi:hypothetical protein